MTQMHVAVMEQLVEAFGFRQEHEASYGCGVEARIVDALAMKLAVFDARLRCCL